jgi:hypothetical protein
MLSTIFFTKKVALTLSIHLFLANLIKTSSFAQDDKVIHLTCYGKHVVILNEAINLKISFKGMSAEETK